jgi:predicted MFS family arabinose efflux permease
MSEGGAAAAPQEEGPRYRFYVVFLLTLTASLSIADRLIFSILMEDIKAEFALSDAQLGLLAGAAFTVTYIVLGFPFARLADRSTRKNIVAGALTFWSAMTAVCGLTVGYWTMFLARVGVGIGEAASGPSSQSMIADYFRREEMARAMGILTVGATMGTAGGLIIGGLMAEAYGWRAAFLLVGAPGLILGLIVYLTLREPLRGRYAPKGATTTQTPLGDTLKSLLGNKVFVWLVIGFTIQNMIGYAMAIWMPAVMLRNYDVSTGDVALYLGLAFVLGGLPGPIIGGFLTDWLTRRNEKWRAWLPGLVSFGCLLPLWLSLNAGEFWAFLGLFALAYGIFVSSQASILSLLQASVEPAQRGFAVALALSLNNLVGQGVGAGVVGWTSDRLAPAYGAFSLNIAVMAICLSAGVVALAVFARLSMHMESSGYIARVTGEERGGFS